MLLYPNMKKPTEPIPPSTTALKLPNHGIYMLAAAMEAAGSDYSGDIVSAAAGLEIDTPSGTIRMDDTNQHAWLNIYIGKVNSDLTFDIVSSSDGLVAPVVDKNDLKKRRCFMGLIISQLVNGISGSAELFLAAVGMVIIFGMLDVVNMAHGELIMLGAYAACIGTGRLNLPFGAALVFAFVFSALIGILLEHLLIRRLYGKGG